MHIIYFASKKQFSSKKFYSLFKRWFILMNTKYLLDTNRYISGMILYIVTLMSAITEALFQSYVEAIFIIEWNY